MTLMLILIMCHQPLCGMLGWGQWDEKLQGKSEAITQGGEL